MATSLAGKTAIVTGAGSGINLAFARLLLRNQCNVVFADLALRPEAKEVVDAHASTSSSASRAVFQKTDVRDWQQLEAMFHVAIKEFGGFDIVCPGAGIWEPPFSSFWHPPGSPKSRDSPSSSHYASLEINITHPIRTTQLAIAHFLSIRRSAATSPTTSDPPSNEPLFHIIHVSSIAGQVTPLIAPLYNASKHAVSGFVRTLAPLDAEYGIRVTAVAPGVIDTPMWRENPDKLRLFSDEGGDQWVSADDVAEVMGSLVDGREKVDVVAASASAGGGATGLPSGDSREGWRKVKAEGGLILEVSKGRVRKVEQFMDAGPMGAGNTVSNAKVAYQDIFSMLGSGTWGT
ncbi:MAG: hypothetical protein L6R37_003475 [Teloschistes peruensis]|nr:MAG: hypothetical protein L6R37_003475 [Teloschistes peruensis]